MRKIISSLYPLNRYEPAYDKTYNNTCVTSKDSDQPVHPPGGLGYRSLGSPEVVEGTCYQLRL